MSEYQPMYDSFKRGAQERFVPAPRINVSANVYLPASEMDVHTGQLKPDRVRRHRTQGERLEAEALAQEERRLKETLERERNKKGVRVTFRSAGLLAFVLFCICALTIGCQLAAISGLQEDINTLQRDIQACKTDNSDLEVEIALASDPAVICYAASQNLNMIPAASAKAIHLTAVDTRPLQPDSSKVQVATTTAQVQTTQTPVIASAGN